MVLELDEQCSHFHLTPEDVFIETIDLVDAIRETTAYIYTVLSPLIAGSLPIGVIAQIRPTTVTKRAVHVVLPKAVIPTDTSIPSIAPPAH